jgi:hypothetical protein
MARSTYIYLVTKDGSPVAAFTVKHELATWLSRNQGDYVLYRIGDGLRQSKPPTIMEAP